MGGLLWSSPSPPGACHVGAQAGLAFSGGELVRTEVLPGFRGDPGISERPVHTKRCTGRRRRGWWGTVARPGRVPAADGRRVGSPRSSKGLRLCDQLGFPCRPRYRASVSTGVRTGRPSSGRRHRRSGWRQESHQDVSRNADLLRGAADQVQVDDPLAPLQSGNRCGCAVEPVAEGGECPGAVLAAETDERAGAPLLGKLARFGSAPERVNGHRSSHFLFNVIDPSQCAWLFQRLGDGIALSSGHPIRSPRARVTSERAKEGRIAWAHHLSYLVSASNAVREDRPLTRLVAVPKLRAEPKRPVFTSTPTAREAQWHDRQRTVYAEAVRGPEDAAPGGLHRRPVLRCRDGARRPGTGIPESGRSPGAPGRTSRPVHRAVPGAHLDEGAVLGHGLPAFGSPDLMPCGPLACPPLSGTDRREEAGRMVGALGGVEVEQGAKGGCLVVAQVGAGQVAIEVGGQEVGVGWGPEGGQGDAVRTSCVRGRAFQEEFSQSWAEGGGAGYRDQPGSPNSQGVMASEAWAGSRAKLSRSARRKIPQCTRK